MHSRMDLAKLRLVGKFDREEVRAAEAELLQKGYIDVCYDDAHSANCVVITQKGLA